REFPPTTSIPTGLRRSCFPRRQCSDFQAAAVSGRGAIEVEDLSKLYTSQDGPVQALSQVSFTVADAEFVSIVGHSGCGKSTLLKIVAGLLSASSGSVTV